MEKLRASLVRSFNQIWLVTKYFHNRISDISFFGCWDLDQILLILWYHQLLQTFLKYFVKLWICLVPSICRLHTRIHLQLLLIMITTRLCSATNVSTNEFQIDIMKYFCFIYPIIIILVLKSLHPATAGPVILLATPFLFASQHISRSIRNLFLSWALIDRWDRVRC